MCHRPAGGNLRASRYKRPGTGCEAQDVVILGSGAFACEAMEEAVANNARSVTLVARERRRCCRPQLCQHGHTYTPLNMFSSHSAHGSLGCLTNTTCADAGCHKFAPSVTATTPQVAATLFARAQHGRHLASATAALGLEDGAHACVAGARLLRPRWPGAHDAARRRLADGLCRRARLHADAM